MDVRREILEFGLLPSAVLASRFDSVSAVTDLHSKLLKETETIDGQQGRTPSLFRLVAQSVCQGMFVSARKRWRLCSEDETRVELHALSLFLFTQVYGKQASRRTDYELQENNRETPRGMAPRGLNALTFSSFLRRHLQILLYLIKDNPPELSSSGWCLPRSPSPGVASPSLHHQDPTRGTIWISREEVDRLELLLKRRPCENGDGKREYGSDIYGVASCLSCFKNYNKDVFAAASCIEVAACLKGSILDTEGEQDVTSGTGKICGMTKGTLVEGEDGFPDDQLMIHECQDCCIYALAPLARVKITACSDCIIILGPTSGCVLVENCTRIKLIYAATSTCITACHESILHLATARSPLLLGDNRFLQLAPFNIEYEHLPTHLKIAGLDVSVNKWDQPILLNLFREIGRDEDGVDPSLESGCKDADGRWMPEVSIEDLLLPPEQLLPFTVPFRGGPGPLAGGAPSSSQVSWVNRLGSGMGNGPSFPLSPVYATALTARLRKVAELQESVGKAISDLNNRRDVQVAIQRYFKEWLFKTAKIRQVYDLAKLEQQMISETNSGNPSSSTNHSTST